jgi:hypothetical protein
MLLSLMLRQLGTLIKRLDNPMGLMFDHRGGRRFCPELSGVVVSGKILASAPIIIIYYFTFVRSCETSSSTHHHHSLSCLPSKKSPSGLMWSVRAAAL